MQKLRSLHLYLGCIFAPLLLFFAASGLWQMFEHDSDLLRVLSSIHTSRALKNGQGLTSIWMFGFVVLMALSFIVTTIIGVMMALKYGKKTAAFRCLALGVIIPLALVVLGLL